MVMFVMMWMIMIVVTMTISQREMQRKKGERWRDRRERRERREREVKTGALQEVIMWKIWFAFYKSSLHNIEDRGERWKDESVKWKKGEWPTK